MLNAFCLLTKGLFVSSELPALEEPWSISSEERVATASFADIEMRDPRMVQSTKPCWDTFLWSGVHRHANHVSRSPTCSLLRTEIMSLLKGEGKADVCAQLEQASLLFRIVQAAVAWYLLISGIVQTLGLAVFIRTSTPGFK